MNRSICPPAVVWSLQSYREKLLVRSSLGQTLKVSTTVATATATSCSAKPAMLFKIGVATRVVLLLYGELQDSLSSVKYTDIDYQVFSDAAAFVAHGRSPYERSTYRYTPLLAWLLTPNVLCHPMWGKVLFSAADILAAWYKIISQVLQLRSGHNLTSCMSG